jgi:sortase A
MHLDKALSVIGRAFIAAGILVFLFVAYQLWGTDISEARSQSHLKAQVAKEFPTTTTVKGGTATSPSQSTPNTAPAPPPAPQGDAVAVISIPKISLEKTVVEGTGVPDLKKGPGHYTNTPLPGQPGNAAIAGHRTTYGAPFGNIGELNAGDEIDVTTKQGSFVYKVTGQQVVDPSDVSVLAPTNDNRLTLTTCHPKYSAAKRLVITAALQGPAAQGTNTSTTVTPPAPSASTSGNGSTTTTDKDASTISNPAAQLSGATLSGTADSKTPAVLWGIATAVVAILTYVGSRIWRRWWSYIIGTPIFFVLLFIFFENFSRLLPANA